MERKKTRLNGEGRREREREGRSEVRGARKMKGNTKRQEKKRK